MFFKEKNGFPEKLEEIEGSIDSLKEKFFKQENGISDKVEEIDKTNVEKLKDQKMKVKRIIAQNNILQKAQKKAIKLMTNLFRTQKMTLL